MKRFLLIAFFAIALVSCIGKPSMLNGRYLSQDKEYIYTFTDDSLYIDCANSGCYCASYKIRYKCASKDNGSVYEFETNEIDYPLITRKNVKFLIEIKLLNDSLYELSYGHDKDIISKIP